jgi:hypothetical protein
MDGFEKDTNQEEIAEKYYWEVGLFYFETNNLGNRIKDTELSITRLSKEKQRKPRQHAPNGLKDRIERTQHYNRIIK